MKFILPFLFIFSACLMYSQTPQNVSISRYILPGIPKITGLTSIKNNKAQKQVWFTERDSMKVGTLIFPRACRADSTHEYTINGVHPYRITYAEKAITISDNAVRPAKATKHTPTVWFIDYSTNGMGSPVTGRDSIYGLEPAAKKSNTGYLVTYPTSSATIVAGEPWGIQWAAPSHGVPASIWFHAINARGNPVFGDIYSLEPRARGTTPYEAILTRYNIPSVNTVVMAVHVENGFVWSLQLNTSNSSLSLYMMPTTGGPGLSWLIGSNPSSYMIGGIQPLYSVTKPKANILPNQIWVNLLHFIYVITLNPSLSSTAIDTICMVPTDTNTIVSLFSDNVSKTIPGKWMHCAFVSRNSQTVTYSSNIGFLRATPSETIQRTAVQFSTLSATINGIVRPVIQTAKNLQPVCGTQAPVTDTPTGCVTREIELSTGGAFLDSYGSDVDITMIVGMSDTKKFDFVANQHGGFPFPSPSTEMDQAAIMRITGSYSTTGAMAGESEQADPEFTFDEENAAQASEYSLNDAYPNPFNPVTNIQFSIPAQSVVTLKVYNMLGEEVASLLDGVSMSEGTQTIPFDASALPSGVYFYRIQAQSTSSRGNEPLRTYSSMKKVVLVK